MTIHKKKNGLLVILQIMASGSLSANWSVGVDLRLDCAVVEAVLLVLPVLPPLARQVQPDDLREVVRPVRLQLQDALA
jgi:hypothetical protein